MSARQRVIHAAARCITLLSFSLAMALSHAVPTAAATCESLSSVEIPFSTITTTQSVPAGTFNAPDGTTWSCPGTVDTYPLREEGGPNAPDTSTVFRRIPAAAR